MLPTKDHDEIRVWAARHGALPAEVRGSENGTPALLAFLLVGGVTGPRDLKTISWDDFFARFDLLELSMAWDDLGHFALVRVDNATAQS